MQSMSLPSHKTTRAVFTIIIVANRLPSFHQRVHSGRESEQMKLITLKGDIKSDETKLARVF